MSSKIVPFEVHTGCVKGWREREQKLNGRRLNGAWVPPLRALAAPAPMFAEYASSEAHSEWVICWMIVSNWWAGTWTG